MQGLRCLSGVFLCGKMKVSREKRKRKKGSILQSYFGGFSCLPQRSRQISTGALNYESTRFLSLTVSLLGFRWQC